MSCHSNTCPHGGLSIIPAPDGLGWRIGAGGSAVEDLSKVGEFSKEALVLTLYARGAITIPDPGMLMSTFCGHKEDWSWSTASPLVLAHMELLSLDATRFGF